MEKTLSSLIQMNIPQQQAQPKEKGQTLTKALENAHYAILKSLSLFIHPFNCPVEYLNQYSICFYPSSNSYIFQLRHFQPCSDKIKYDQNFLTFKWWINSSGFKAFESQAFYLNTFMPSQEDWLYFLINFDLADILKQPEPAPKVFIQPNAIKAVSPKSLKELTLKKAQMLGLKIQGFEPIAEEVVDKVADKSKKIKKDAQKKKGTPKKVESVKDSEEEEDEENHL